ncbi:GAF domain-containing protein [Brevibacterium sp. ZH18]|uniref:GAF domain-containing protein n=1 Tax=Brevibacterium sp. ZH18 TaxID=2927784 RepID=UPI001F62266B|nr:GAF domain-containing protein [Brevibacterium sp. ZH18]MCI4010795.1 GAF domain-containing protein [Brevibacterium sp. ZH18]
MPQPDLAHLAKDLSRIHDAVITGGSPPEQPRALVKRSWDRMLRLGLDPAGGNHRIVAAEADVQSRRHRSKLRLIVEEMKSVLLQAPEAATFILVVTDADGVILWRDGAAAARRQADGLGFVEGAHWSESIVGTNAIGTALAEEAPVQLFSAEHFESAQHPWYCSAVPVHDPNDGRLLGVVDISGPALTLHPTVQSLVTTAVRLAEARLMIHQQERLSSLRTRMSTVLRGSRSPALVVDDDGWVAYQQGVQARDRIEVPAPDRTILIPGAGLCLPERIAGGWLLQPASGDGGRQVAVVLRQSVQPAVVEIDSNGEPLTVPLTPRRAQILAAITSAGPTGVSASELSLKLYGDADHLVTVRAEVSRLRRSIGALIATQPYRWAEGVTARLE